MYFNFSAYSYDSGPLLLCMVSKAEQRDSRAHTGHRCKTHPSVHFYLFDSIEQAQAQFPAITLFQRQQWTSQAHLLAGKSKCFLDWYDDNAPMCNSLSTEQITPGQACNCNDSWSVFIVYITWQRVSYRSLSFMTAANLIASEPSYLMKLQAFFTCRPTPPTFSNELTDCHR